MPGSSIASVFRKSLVPGKRLNSEMPLTSADKYPTCIAKSLPHQIDKFSSSCRAVFTFSGLTLEAAMKGARNEVFIGISVHGAWRIDHMGTNTRSSLDGPWVLHHGAW